MVTNDRSAPRRPARTVDLPRLAVRPTADEVIAPRVLTVLEEIIRVHEYLTAAKLPQDLVKELVLHHQRHYLERL